MDVVNYPGAYVGKWYEVNELPAVQKRDGVHILVLAKGYTPEDVAKAHDFCESRAKAGPSEMAEGTVADTQLQADIGNMIRTMEAVDHPGCELQIVKQLHSGDTLGVERWDVRSCDATNSYNVEIVASPKGGSDFRVVKSKSVQAQVKTGDTAAPPPATSQTAATDASPEELIPYDGQKSQFTIALPKGWLAHDQTQMPMGTNSPEFNLILFYDTKPGLEFGGADDVKLLTGIDSGEIPSFFVQKFPAKKGMSCAGFSDKAEKDVFKMVTRDPILGKGAGIREAPNSEPAPVNLLP